MGKDAVSIYWWSWLINEYTSKYHKIPDDNSELLTFLSICSCHVLTLKQQITIPCFHGFHRCQTGPRLNTHHKSFGRPPWHKYQFVGCKSREKQLYWAPQSACQFHQNVHCWLESEWFANGVVCFGGVRIVCIDKSYILYTVYKYNLQFCCIWWLLLCSCHSCAGCSCFFCYYWCVFPTRFLGQHLPRKSTLTTSKPLKAKVFGMINCSLCWMVGDCGLRDSCKERKIRKKIKTRFAKKNM